MHILVTGASGFVGRALLPRLAIDHTVTALHSGSQDREDTDRCSWRAVDFNAGIDVADLPDHVDAIVHLAASYAHRGFPGTASDIFAVNTRSTAELLDYAQQVGCSQFVYGSTGSVYAPTHDPISEEHTVDPSEYFGATKAASELLVNQYRNEMTVVSLRLFFPYGPGQTDRLIPALIGRVRDGVPITLAGTDGFRFAPILVRDVADVIAKAIDDRWDGVLNVGGRDLCSLRDLGALIGEQLGTEPKFEHSNAALGADFDVDLTALAARIDTGGFTSLADGLAETIAAS